MRVLHSDTETTGLPVSGVPSNDPRQPKLVTLGWILDNDDGSIKAQHSAIIKPDGYTWEPNGPAFNAHKITHERAMDEGVPLANVMELYREALDQAEIIAAFNAFFDVKFLKIACAQLGDPGELIRQFIETKSSLCTMNAAAKHLTGKRMIKLTEAYRLLVGGTVQDHHTALADAHSSRSIFHALDRLGALPDPTPLTRKEYDTPYQAEAAAEVEAA